MKKVLYTSFSAIGLLLSTLTGTAQSVGIGTTTPNASAALQISATNKGLLIPNVNLSGANDNTTIASPVKGLMVWNTNNTLGEGVYYNSNTPVSPVWVKLSTGSGAAGWGLSGNAGTTNASFIGTTDNKFLRIRSNNIRIGELSRLNLFLGDSAGIAVDTSSAFGNIGIGIQALTYGDDPLSFPLTGVANIGIGVFALSATAGDIGSIGIGYEALVQNDDPSGQGNFNVGIGAFAGESISFTGEGYNNTAIGSFTDCYDTTNDVDVTNATAIGAGAFVDQSDMVRIGDDNVQTIGGIQDWTTLSDGRFKKDIRTETSGLNFIMELRPVNYRLDYSKMRNYGGAYTGKRTIKLKNGTIVPLADKFNIGLSPRKQRKIKGDGKLYNGLIAQEVEVAAKKVGYEFSGVSKPTNPNGRYGLKYATFVVPLIESVQEQQKTIEEQNKKIDDLTKRLEKLEALSK